jgi:hypothetical protein
MNAILPDSCLTDESVNKLATTSAAMLRELRDTYKGKESFVSVLSQRSGIKPDEVERFLSERDEHQLATLFNGVELEGLLAAAKIFPEELVKRAGVGVEPDGQAESSVAFGNFNSFPSPEYDKKIRELFDIMSEFFLISTLRKNQKHEHQRSPNSGN